MIGPMGAGKTTVGSILANKIGRDFYDVDRELEKRTGVSVSVIFEIEKESGFRARETQMLRDLLQKPPCVIATGGGIVVTEENLRQIQESKSCVIYLKTSVRQQLKRLKRDKQRPLLQSDDRKQKLQDLAKSRNHLYESIASKTIKTGHQSAYKMASVILRNYILKDS